MDYRNRSRSRSPLERNTNSFEQPNPRLQQIVERMRNLRKISTNILRNFHEQSSKDLSPVLENLPPLLENFPPFIPNVSPFHETKQNVNKKLMKFEPNKLATAQERSYRNRTNCLDSSILEFTGLLDKIKLLPVEKPPHGQVKKEFKTTYSRYTQERFQSNTESEFQIDTDLTFAANILPKPRALGNLRKRIKKEPDPVQLYAPIKKPDPTTLATLIEKKPELKATVKSKSSKPIIVIPASGTALITMYNVVDILQDLTYVTTNEKKRLNIHRQNEVLIHRKKNETVRSYRVIDNPLRLNDEEWSRVVAVFVQGPAWQFKNWKWNGNQTEIFSHVCAFHLKYDDQTLDPNVAKSNVNVLQVSKTKRHFDKAVLLNFWKILDCFISSHKFPPYLLY